MNISNHLNNMQSALELAERGRFTVSPNPMVGCVIVKNDRIVGQGFHHYAGGPHAEVIALQEAGEEARGATAYVTLEPCCHYGKTPPCAKALIQAGIKQVFAACVDPNSLVVGKGIEALRAANIEVNVGLCEDEAKKLNAIFFHYMRYQRPFVIAKWAMSLDGKTVTHQDDTRDISSPASQQVSHRIRQKVDAILIGANTARHDNPLLTVRSKPTHEPVTKQPLRIILSSQGKLPLDLRMFESTMPAKTIIATTKHADKKWRQLANEKNISVMTVDEKKDGQVDLLSLLDQLGKMGITSLLVEGGMSVHESFITENLVNQFHVYLAPVIIGDLNKKQHVNNVNLTRIGSDFHFTADSEECTHV